jgi:hypothetical protein
VPYVTVLGLIAATLGVALWLAARPVLALMRGVR